MDEAKWLTEGDHRVGARLGIVLLACKHACMHTAVAHMPLLSRPTFMPSAEVSKILFLQGYKGDLNENE